MDLMFLVSIFSRRYKTAVAFFKIHIKSMHKTVRNTKNVK